jgi:hypothetical protein
LSVLSSWWCRAVGADYDSHGNKVAGGNCGDPISAQLFFVFYALVMLFIVIEMFVNVIMEKFEEQAELAHLPITSNDIMDFAEVWSRFDPKAHGRIPEELMSISKDSGPVLYPGGELEFEKGFLEELSERVPLLGADPNFENDLSEKVSDDRRLSLWPPSEPAGCQHAAPAHGLC